ncbi:MAG: DUF1501 domain-containing protein [Myxococcota bacterium]
MQRRQFLAGMGAVGASGLLAPAWAGPGSTSAPNARFVVLMLRGGLDGLGVVPAYGDPKYRSARGDLALPAPRQSGGVLDLDGTFGLHPALAPLMPLYKDRALLVAHAVAAPYRERSHFDGQNVLETGMTQPFASRSGWLARTLARSPGGMAIGKTVPQLLRGPNASLSLDPLRTPRPDAPLHRAVAELYAGDPTLAAALERGQAAQRLLARHAEPRASRRADVAKSARVAARLLSDPEGPRTATFSIGGWDTHSGQKGRLGRQLGVLASAFTSFAEAMPPDVWAKTVILAVTEFGRTVQPNGTGGTDHGVGGVALVAGGAVAGGRVVADWPGLAERQRLEGRDLRPTTDLRALMKGLLHDHLRVSPSRLNDDVFPGSTSVAPLRGLIRG